MKNNVLYLTALALAAIMSTTGCKHKPVAVTPIPHGANYGVNDMGNPPTLPPGPAYGDTGGPGVKPIAENNNRPLSDYDMDRDKLAAYTVHFAYDSAVIRDNEQANIQGVAQALQADSSASLLIEGNCDERGTEEYNRSLGERRALAAREAMASLNIDPSRIRTISYGKDKPADPGHDEAAFAKNRHDDFVLLHLKAGM
jgi:peptidoglycan-associated lipoprotein